MLIIATVLLFVFLFSSLTTPETMLSKVIRRYCKVQCYFFPLRLKVILVAIGFCSFEHLVFHKVALQRYAKSGLKKRNVKKCFHKRDTIAMCSASKTMKRIACLVYHERRCSVLVEWAPTLPTCLYRLVCKPLDHLAYCQLSDLF